jgi:hypothetical protein
MCVKIYQSAYIQIYKYVLWIYTSGSLSSYHLLHIDSLALISLGKFAKNFCEFESSTTFNQASFETHENGFRLTLAISRAAPPGDECVCIHVHI